MGDGPKSVRSNRFYVGLDAGMSAAKSKAPSEQPDADLARYHPGIHEGFTSFNPMLAASRVR
ncbi:MAG: hypothetical protein AAGA21_22185 [Pseudomonadota bacterium]